LALSEALWESTQDEFGCELEPRLETLASSCISHSKQLVFRGMALAG
jgi:hypothetical protein